MCLDSFLLQFFFSLQSGINNWHFGDFDLQICFCVLTFKFFSFAIVSLSVIQYQQLTFRGFRPLDLFLCFWRLDSFRLQLFSSLQSSINNWRFGYFVLGICFSIFGVLIFFSFAIVSLSTISSYNCFDQGVN